MPWHGQCNRLRFLRGLAAYTGPCIPFTLSQTAESHSLLLASTLPHAPHHTVWKNYQYVEAVVACHDQVTSCLCGQVGKCFSQ